MQLYVHLSVCLSACLFVCLFSGIQSAAKRSPKFTKPSAYVKFGLLRLLTMLWAVHVPVCTHSTQKHARYFCVFFASFLSVFVIWTEGFRIQDSAKCGFSEENQCFSGGYPESIYCVWGLIVLSFTHAGCSVICPPQWWAETTWCSVTWPPQGLGFLAF